MTTSITLNHSIISAAIGYRSDNGTVTSEVKVNLDHINQETITALLEKGLYALCAEYKTAGKPESDMEFTALMAGFSMDRVEEFATRERKRGKASVEYSQAMRVVDATALEKLQARALRFNRFIPLPATPSVSFAELVKNKNESVLKGMDLYNVASEWSLLRNGTDTIIDTNASNAINALSKYLSDIGNPAFTQ